MSHQQRVHRNVMREQQRRIRALGTRQMSRPVRRPTSPRRIAARQK